MEEKKIKHVCQSCGWEGSKWHGRCPQCSSWNSIVEELQSLSVSGKRFSLSTKDSVPLPFSKIATDSLKRYPSGLAEFDRVLGGGLTPGAFVLLGGDPGIGKSTLLLQVCGSLAQKYKTLYISAEESARQTALRAHRLKMDHSNLLFFSEGSLEKILHQSEKNKPEVMVVDSIQTIYLDSLPSAPGTVSQVRESASRLMSYAKSCGIAIFIVGHVTKEGSLAGPRVLEHLVDTVLSFEGDAHYPFRILRSTKNRFGPSNEIAVFEMGDGGLEEITHPSKVFLREKSEDRIGSSVFTAMEGSRPLLCEIQALTVSSYLSIPRRTALGVDLNRVQMVAAVLDKYMGTELGKRDLFVNLAGGLKITEPASDLAVALAILSSRYKKPLHRHTCFFGELGLTGELRACRFSRERVKEAEKLGFQEIYLPRSVQSYLKKDKFKIKLNFKDHLEEFSSFKTTSS